MVLVQRIFLSSGGIFFVREHVIVATNYSMSCPVCVPLVTNAMVDEYAPA